MIITLAAVVSYNMVLVNPVIAPVEYANHLEATVSSVKEDYEKLYWSDKAKKEVAKEFDIEIYDDVEDDTYIYLVTIEDRIYKLTANETVGMINRNTKFTAVIAEDELMLTWPGNNLVGIEIKNRSAENEYVYVVYEGQLIE